MWKTILSLTLLGSHTILATGLAAAENLPEIATGTATGLTAHWTGEGLMIEQSRSPQPPWDRTQLGRSLAVDWQRQQIWRLNEEIGAGFHWQRALLLDAGQGYAIDQLARTWRPLGERDFFATALQQSELLPPLLLTLLNTAPERVTAIDGVWEVQLDDETRWRLIPASPDPLQNHSPDDRTDRLAGLERSFEGFDGSRHQVRFDYQDYRRQAGISVPDRVVMTVDRQPVQTFQLQQLNLGTPSAQYFTLPDGYQQVPARPADRQAYRAETLSPGLHWIGQGVMYQLFLEWDEGIIAMDATSGDVTGRIAAIRERLPGRAITHILVSHHHDDHLHGLDEYVAQGATVIASPAHEGVIRAHLGSDTPAEFVWVKESPVQLGKGTSQLFIHDIETPHSRHNLVAYLPASRTLYQADLWVSHDHAPQVATPNMLTLQQAIEDLGLAVETIVDAHSAVVQRAGHLVEAVRRARQLGLGLERELGEPPVGPGGGY